MSWAKPESNSAPWLPTRWTVAGIADSARSTPSARPEISATAVSGSSASAISAAAAAGSGRASAGLLTIGASVPSKSEVTSRRGVRRAASSARCRSAGSTPRS